MTTMTDLATLVRRNRTLWAGVCWTVAIVLAGFGAPFAIGGTRVSPLPSAYIAITRYVPGGLHTYGAVMLIFAAALLSGLVQPLRGRPIPEEKLQLVLVAFCGFVAGIVFAFAASWALVNVATYQAIIYWSSLGGLAALAAKEAPKRNEGDGAS